MRARVTQDDAGTSCRLQAVGRRPIRPGCSGASDGALSGDERFDAHISQRVRRPAGERQGSTAPAELVNAIAVERLAVIQVCSAVPRGMDGETSNATGQIEVTDQFNGIVGPAAGQMSVPVSDALWLASHVCGDDSNGDDVRQNDCLPHAAFRTCGGDLASIVEAGTQQDMWERNASNDPADGDVVETAPSVIGVLPGKGAGVRRTARADLISIEPRAGRAGDLRRAADTLSGDGRTDEALLEARADVTRSRATWPRLSLEPETRDQTNVERSDCLVRSFDEMTRASEGNGGDRLQETSADDIGDEKATSTRPAFTVRERGVVSVDKTQHLSLLVQSETGDDVGVEISIKDDRAHVEIVASSGDARLIRSDRGALEDGLRSAIGMRAEVSIASYPDQPPWSASVGSEPNSGQRPRSAWRDGASSNRGEDFGVLEVDNEGRGKRSTSDAANIRRGSGRGLVL